MAQLIVRNLDEDVKRRLQQRAALHARSVEAEVRAILGEAVRDTADKSVGLGSRLRLRFAGIGLDTDIPELRGQEARPAEFGE